MLVIFLTVPAEAQFVTTRIASGLDAPIFITSAPGRPDSMFVVERGGTIKIMDRATGQINATPFLSIPDVNTTGEGALIGLAFHPDFAANGRFYVNLTTDPSIFGASLTTRIREYTVTDLLGNPDVADPTPKEILKIDQPHFSHNGGWIGFSPTDPNNKLYIMSGDGGNADDTGPGHTLGTGNAQDITDNLFGKVLRIDIDGDDFAADPARNYAVPADNPFVGVTGDDEIWSYGLRNPFRASFDRQTGDLYIGDVGQSNREEINFLSSSSTGGENYGWRLREGDIATPTGGVGGPPPPGNVDPIYDYEHGGEAFQGHSVTGGVLYRGPVAELQGKYIFGDFVTANIWSFDPTDPDNTIERINDNLVPNNGAVNSIASFGEDQTGNLYIVDLGGEVFRVAIQGDLNGDGFVGVDDLNAVLNQWNLGVAPGSLTGDINGNGFVGVDDLNIVLVNWNQSVTPGDLLAGDPSGDGFVGVDDLNLILTQWNQGGTPDGLLLADSNGDGFVGVDDLNAVLNNWNAGTPPSEGAIIPEPGTLALFAGFLAAVTTRRQQATYRAGLT